MKKSLASIRAFVFVLTFIVTCIPMQNKRVTATSARNDIPMLISVKQIAYDTLQITFDKPCDVKKATKPSNYWLQDVLNINPTGIASLGEDERLSAENALSADQAIVTPADNSGKVFHIKFSEKIPTGAKYRLIICYITTSGAPEYTGDNGQKVFIGL